MEDRLLDMSKTELAALLEPEYRRAFLERCAAIEKQYTEECAARNDPCLDSGCSVAGVEGEACLQPLLRSETEYRKACVAEWTTFLRNGTAA
jgi:hypothetical protein